MDGGEGREEPHRCQSWGLDAAAGARAGAGAGLRRHSHCGPGSHRGTRCQSQLFLVRKFEDLCRGGVPVVLQSGAFQIFKKETHVVASLVIVARKC